MADTLYKTVRDPLVRLARSTFISFGILPVVLVGTMILFGAIEERFLSSLNLFNVARQTTYLAIALDGTDDCPAHSRV